MSLAGETLREVPRLDGPEVACLDPSLNLPSLDPTQITKKSPFFQKVVPYLQHLSLAKNFEGIVKYYMVSRVDIRGVL